MKRTLIPKIEIENRHPKGMHSTTDMEYAKIATDIATAMSRLKINDITADGFKLLGLNIAMYFEDVVADAGIWRAFTDRMKEQQGKYLPFFDVDESNYYQDEPNLDDVRFLVWYTMLEVHHDRITNPESPVIRQLAEAAFTILAEHFETVSVNDELKDFFVHPQFTDSFVLQRDVLKWLCFGCYLTYIPHLPQRLFTQAQTVTQNARCNMDMAYCMAECVLPYNNKIGPLKLLPQQWAADILRANGNNDAANTIESQRFKPYQGYKIVGGEVDKSITLEDVNGETFSISAENMGHPHEDCYKQKMAIASFVEYNGVWYLNDVCAWSDNLQPFETLHNDYIGKEHMKDALDKLRKGTALYYFANQQDMEKFLLQNLPFDENAKKNLKLPEGENIALYIPEDCHKDIQILPDAAMCIKDANNPYYNQKMALNQALNLAISIEEEVRGYIIAHHLLPDATINSSQGLKRGNEIVQQNFDFLAKAFVSKH